MRNPRAPSPYSSSQEVQFFLLQFFLANNWDPKFGTEEAAQRASVLHANGETLYKMTKDDFKSYFQFYGEIIYEIVQDGIWDYVSRCCIQKLILKC